VALDATLSVRSPNGVREIAAADFFRAPTAENKRMNVLEPNEIITAYQLPHLENSRSVYLKEMDRATWTFALASAAVRLDMREGKISGARVVIGGVANVPWREHRAEEILVGEKISEKVAARAAEECLRDAKPLAHNAYKVRLARTLVKRAILAAAEK
jgi:xanthine dehydrogenase YagS FAD-binding subunit